MNSNQVIQVAHKHIYDREFFKDGWLWRQMAIHELLDFRNDYAFVRKMACEVFELGLIPLPKHEFEICQNISKFLHLESDHVSSEDFQHILYRFKNDPEKMDIYSRHNKLFAFKAKCAF